MRYRALTTAPLSPVFSTTVVTIVGVVGTAISFGVVNDGNYNWSLPASVVIPGGGRINVVAICETAGSINAPPGSIKRITTPVAGWTGVTNPTSSVMGTPIEGDSTFGSGRTQFLVNSPAAVRQAIQTRLLLWEGEWFLNKTTGTPYTQSILGHSVEGIRDAVIKKVIIQTQGVVSLDKYFSTFDPDTRMWTSVSGEVDTIYSQDQQSTTTFGVIR